MTNRTERRNTGTVAHDPVSPSGGPCPLCDQPWPCDERKRQRRTMRACVHLLRSDLYEPTDRYADEDGTQWVQWRSPLGWMVDLTYGVHGLRARVRGDNRLLAQTNNADAAWLDGAMP